MKTPPPPETKPNIVAVLGEKSTAWRDTLTLITAGWAGVYDAGTVFASIGTSKHWPHSIVIEGVVMTPGAFWKQLESLTENLGIVLIERVRDEPAPEAWDEMVHAELSFVPGVAICQQSMTKRVGSVDCEDCLFYMKRGYDAFGRNV
ncbi:MAG: hypothetical protein V3R81_11920 [Gammaproteobacteria bacterium]